VAVVAVNRLMRPIKRTLIQMSQDGCAEENTINRRENRARRGYGGPIEWPGGEIFRRVLSTLA